MSVELLKDPEPMEGVQPGIRTPFELLKDSLRTYQLERVKDLCDTLPDYLSVASVDVNAVPHRVDVKMPRGNGSTAWKHIHIDRDENTGEINLITEKDVAETVPDGQNKNVKLFNPHGTAENFDKLSLWSVIRSLKVAHKLVDQDKQ